MLRPYELLERRCAPRTANPFPKWLRLPPHSFKSSVAVGGNRLGRSSRGWVVARVYPDVPRSRGSGKGPDGQLGPHHMASRRLWSDRKVAKVRIASRCWTTFGPMEIEIGPVAWARCKSYFTVTKVSSDFSDFCDTPLSLFRDLCFFGGIFFDPLPVVGS